MAEIDGIKVRRRKVGDYTPDDHNANTGTERGTAFLEGAIKEVGLGRSIVADANDKISAGNKTLEAAEAAGIQDVIEIETDGSVLIVHKRTDWDLDQPGAARRYAYIDNRASELNLNWAAAVLLQDAKETPEVIQGIFTSEELKEIVGKALAREASEVDYGSLEKMEEIHAKWNVQPGEIWVIPTASGLFSHRLICGDSTDKAVVDRVLDGAVPFLCITDPPYGVSYDATWRADYGAERGRHSSFRMGEVKNDDIVDWTAAYKLFPGDVMYVWHAATHAPTVAMNLLACQFEIRTQIIWKKPNLVLSRGNYHWQHEPCWYSVRKGHKANWLGDRKQSTIWEVAVWGKGQETGDDSRTEHSTQKPVELYRRPILNHTIAGDRVYDPFPGSGTIFAAAELTGRQAFGIELNPPYCSIILERLEGMGLKPVRASEALHGQ